VFRDSKASSGDSGDLALTLTILRSVVFSGHPDDVISYNIFPDDGKKCRGQMKIRFASLSQAQACLRRVRQMDPVYFHSQPLRVQVNITHRCRFHGDMFDCMTKSFEEIFTTARQNQVTVYTHKSGHGKHSWMIVKLSIALGIVGDDDALLAAFRSTKRALSTLLIHRVFEHKSSSLLFTQQGRKYMEWLSQQQHGFIHWFHNTVRLFGTEAQLELMTQYLHDFVTNLEASLVTTTVVIHRRHVRTTMSSLRKLRELPNVLNAFLSGRILEIVCTTSSEAAEKFLRNKHIQFNTSGEDEDESSETDCPICYCDVENGHVLAVCGHAACLACLKLQMDSCRMHGKFPLTCSVENCGQSMAWSDIEQICDVTQLQTVTEASFAKFRQAHLAQFVNCRGMDCGQIFHSDSKDVYCDQCDTDYCLPCSIRRDVAAPTHCGYACDDLDEKKGDAMFAKLFATGQMAPCPNPECKVPTEKNSGCYHMTCANCQAHYCWGCMHIFSGDRMDCTCASSQQNAWGGGDDASCRYVYHHMSHCSRPVHGGGGTGWF
jgi:hypothetical protein